MPDGSLDPRDSHGRRRRTTLAFVGAVLAVTCVVLGVTVYGLSQRLAASAEPPQPALRPTGTILMAIRDVARLETSELHLEKVIDLTDRQSRFFGLLKTTDAVLLIAAGDVTIGIDLSKLGEQDFAVDRAAGTATLTLPPPEVLSVRLDEEHTYVYSRTTAFFAERNEQLEAKARQEAVRAIGDAARQSEVMEKARKRAEQQLQQLLEKFGVTRVAIGWRPA
jgi:Protein of unknown function (DUF4230)